MMFGVDGDQFLWRIEWDATDSKSSYRVSRIVKNFKIRQCMSRVVTKRGRQRFRVAVNGASLSDDLKQNSQGRNPRIREEKKQPGSEPKNPWRKSSAKQCQQQAMTWICDGSEKIGVRDKAAIRRNAVLVTMRRASACEENAKLKLRLVRILVRSLWEVGWRRRWRQMCKDIAW